MFHKRDFQDYVSPFSLRFTEPSLESRLSAAKEDQIRGLTPHKIFILLAVGIQLFAVLPVNYFNPKNGDLAEFWNIATNCIISSTAILVELVLHQFERLKVLRGFIITTGILFAVTHYNSQEMPYPGAYLGSVAVLILAFVTGPAFASSWITASFAQISGQIAMTITVLVHYSGKVPGALLTSSLLNFNAVLMLGPVIYRVIEKFQKQLIFLGWQLDEELKDWKILVEVLPVGVVVIQGGQVQYSNRSARELLRIAADDHNCDDIRINTTLKGTLHDIHLADTAADLHGVLFGGHVVADGPEMVNVKAHYKPTDAPPVLISVTTRRLSYAASKLVVLQDLTIHEKLDEEKAYRQYQKQFFAMITHELRNPLQGVLGVLELLRPLQVTENSIKQCTIGLNTGKLMLCLIQDMLDLSQMEADKFGLNEETFHPADAVAECIAVMEFQFQKKGIELRRRVDYAGDREIRNDKNRYKQIVLNLLGNALKFTKEGFVEVVVSYQKPTHRFTTSVADTGSGIRPSDIPCLFQIYGKMEAHKAANPQGVGFGLHICKRLSEAMGGTIRVTSTVGKGSEFSFTVADNLGQEEPHTEAVLVDITPCDSYRVLKAERSDSTNINLLGSQSAVQILVVDDEYICGYVLQHMIISLGYHAILAQSGPEALKILTEPPLETKERGRFALVFLDINMPEMNGFDTCHNLLSVCEKAPTIIGLTGDDSEEVKRKGRKSGMAQVITKPVGKDKVAEVLAEFVQSKLASF